MKDQTIVIGGGIMGLSAAYYLHKTGHKVTIIDQGRIDSGASHVNAGYLTPSHIISLASPGMLTQGLKWMFRSDSPFYMKPRLDPSFLQWAWYFKRSATPEKVARAIPVIRDINVLSKDLYQDLHDSGDLGNFQLEHKGLLMLYKTEKSGDKELGVAEKAKALGLEVSTLNQKELRTLEPAVSEDILGAVHYLCDSHTTPNEVMQRLKVYLEKQGVNFRCEEEVTDFKIQDKRITGVVTNKGHYPAAEVVLAAGSWSGLLSRKLNINMPLQPGKGYRINTSRETGIKYPSILMECKVAVTPMNGFTRFAGTMEFSGHNHIIRPERVQAIARAASQYYPSVSLQDSELDQARCGLRPVSPDGLPYIGRLKPFKNTSVITGHAMMGWSLGPASGKLIAELINGEPLSMDISAFDPHRKF